MKTSCKSCFQKQNGINFNDMDNNELSYASVLIGFDKDVIAETVSKIEKQHVISSTIWCHKCLALSINVFNMEPHHSQKVMYQQFSECVREHCNKIVMHNVFN